LLPNEHCGEPFAVGRREAEQGRGKLRQRVFLIGVRPGVEGVRVIVFRFAGANAGANRRGR
jgi:hypothetical protein